MEQGPTNLPAQIANAVATISKDLTPGVIKALDRLIGATVDIPTAKLQQVKAKIDAQTESYKLVEASIAQAAASGAGTDPEIVQRAMNVLVGKEYRKQINREAIAAAMIEDLQEHTVDTESDDACTTPTKELDDDWLNVFERYAEDASSERLQGLWGRVLAGEIRRPGKFSVRTLRFLSEFSQKDALTFETFSKSAFDGHAPKKFMDPNNKVDVSDLIHLETSGLVQGVTGVGLTINHIFDKNGHCVLREEKLCVLLKGKPGGKIEYNALPLTPLGVEVISLIGSRNEREAAKAVAFAIRKQEIHSAQLGVISGTQFFCMEVLWDDEKEKARPSAARS